jgi:hypothetical protein
VRGTSSAPAAGELCSSKGDASQCRECFGCGEPSAACVAAADDPQPEDFALALALALAHADADGVLEGTRRCACGRVYGVNSAGRSMCFVMQASGRRQVHSCVRCDASHTRANTINCTPTRASARTTATSQDAEAA